MEKQFKRSYKKRECYREIAGKHPHPLSRSEATREYHRLRFLSRDAANAGMQEIARDILANFDPKDTLIYLEKGSMKLFYDMIADKLGAYGTMGLDWDEEPAMKKRGQFEGGKPDDAKNWLYIDDWILTGKRVGFLADYPDKFFSYHLVTSDKGKARFDEFGLRGKTVYKLIGDDGPDDYFGQYPVYGFHTVPDVISEVYSSHGTEFDFLWTIFPQINGEAKGRERRLMKY